ncbi:unnamed protein product [marine sediment metagenome]|uniref:Uncharacterized protein n=1 Tax=marine sediment metagenome TaxID=412755 RepID=X0TXA9_9ZZZZ
MQEKKQSRGGVRIPGPGKKIGRPKGSFKTLKKRCLNVRIEPELDDFIQSQSEGKTEIVEIALYELKQKRGA